MGKYFRWVIIGSFALLFVVYALDINLSQQEPPSSTERERSRNPHGGSADEPYMQEVHPYIQRTVRSLERISKISDDVVDKKTNADEAAEKVRAEHRELVDIRSGIQGIQVPSTMSGFHEHYVKGLDHYIAGADMYADALEQEDPKKVEEASKLFDKGNQELDKAAQELRDDQHINIGKIEIAGLDRPHF